jgi:hypothetical protein
MRSYRTFRPFYAVQAETLLQSWICGDIARLRIELDRVAEFGRTVAGDSESHLAGLLRAVARGMRACPDLYASRERNPTVGAYLDLLELLSCIN